MKKVDFAEINRRVSIGEIMSSHGIFPRIKKSGYCLFSSPFRMDTHPSFSVDIGRNRWKDFATGEGGSAIDLCLKFGDAATPYTAACFLSDKYLGQKCYRSSTYSPNFLSSQKKEKETSTIVSFSPVSSLALMAYIASRGIPMEIANAFGGELHYSFSDRNYYGYAIQTINGGYAVRSAFFKGIVGKNGITIFPGKDSRECSVFEGIFSMLSWVVVYGYPTSDIIVLNSVSNVTGMTMKSYDKVYACLDNDSAGKKALDILTDHYDVCDMSGIYAGCNDMNDFLLKTQ